MAAGSFAKVTGTGLALPTTSFATADWGTVSTDADNILTETSAGVYRPDDEGFYLVVAEGEHDSTHNNRQNIQIKIQRNDTDYSGAWNDGYSRNNDNSILWVRAFMIAHFDGSTDDFRIQYRRDAGAGTPAGTFNTTTIKVVQLSEGGTSSLPYGHYGTPTSQSGHTNTWTSVAGLDVITENATATIELQAGGSDIELKEANRPYLFVYGMVNSDAGAGRTHRVARALHNSDPIWHSISSEYQRNSADQYATPAGMGVVRPTTANQDLTFEIIGYTNTHWGVWDTGSWALSAASGEAGVMVIALPSTTSMAVFEDETGNQTVSGTSLVDINAARTTVGTADSPFSRQSNTDVDVTSATDILSHAAFEADRSTANGTRWTGGVRHEIEGTDNTESRGGGFERGDQNSDDCKDVAIATTYVGAVSANDTIQIEKYSPDGNNGGGTFQTQWAGWFLIDLASLAGPVEVTGSANVVASASGVLTQVVEVNAATSDVVATADGETLLVATQEIQVSGFAITLTYTEAGVTTLELTGSGAVVADVTGIPAQSQLVAADSQTVAAASGSLTVSRPLVASAQTVVTATGTVTEVEQLTGNVQAVVEGSGSPIQTQPVAAEASVVVAAVGTPAQTQPVAVSVVVVADADGTASKVIPLNGAAAVVAVSVGVLSETETLTATAVTVTQATGVLVQSQVVTASATVVVQATGAVTETEHLAASAQVVASAAGLVSQVKGLAGHAQAVVRASGVVVETEKATATVVVVAQATGALTQTQPVAATVSVVAAATGVVTVSGRNLLTGQTSVVADSEGTLLQTHPLASASRTVTVAAGTVTQLQPSLELTATAQAVVAATGTPTQNQPVSAQATVVSQASGTLTAVGRNLLTGQSESVVTAEGVGTQTHPVTAEAQVVVSASGTPAAKATLQLAGTAQVAVQTSGSVDVVQSLSASAQAVASTTAQLVLIQPLVAAVTAVAQTSATPVQTQKLVTAVNVIAQAVGIAQSITPTTKGHVEVSDAPVFDFTAQDTLVDGMEVADTAVGGATSRDKQLAGVGTSDAQVGSMEVQDG